MYARNNLERLEIIDGDPEIFADEAPFFLVPAHQVQWIDSNWREEDGKFLPPSEEYLRDAIKGKRLQEANADADAAIAKLAAAYPDSEVKSWGQQVKEAEQFRADQAAATPLLSALADARGIPLHLLATRVLEKSATYATESGRIIGARQRIEDELNAAVTVRDALAVPPLFQILEIERTE